MIKMPFTFCNKCKADNFKPVKMSNGDIDLICKYESVCRFTVSLLFEEIKKTLEDKHA